MTTPEAPRAPRIRPDAITGQLLHRAWLKSGRPDPLIDADAWDGFALTVRAVAEMERIVTIQPVAPVVEKV